MSLWGMNDGKTVAGSVVVTAANSTVVGTSTTFTNFAVGDFMNVGKNDYVITAIANATVMTVVAGETGGTLKGASSNAVYTVQEKPLSVAFASVGLDANNVYGVSTDEMAYANNASTEADNVTHAGWNLRTEGSGGRAGRVFYETLVAASSISSDGRDDSKLPE
jgi:hypothetical protein